ncbi:hypothetical protein D8674_017250 [Pyrus ussuriensis x Pyrus communis]|uniref:Uncharacterized protein n=1 Tax=Pyrus ussuriensis x Pyrus communis TaxID=2448454 RepID=A0A5N5HJB6_9ROSA|nr:hypothetical protein D8674_017250 [Pyrus ussuriensis x Pyrus communis]
MHLRSLSTPVTETSFSCNSSCPNSHSASGFPEFNQESESLSLEGIRRVLSDGNLEGRLVYSFCDMEEFRNSAAPLKSSYTHDHNAMLETAPSLNIFNKASEFRDEMIRRQDSKQEPLERSITIGDSIDVTGLGGFSFEKMRLIEEKEEVEGLKAIRTLRVDEEVRTPVSPPMYLATGLGVGGAGFGCDAWDNDLSMENVDENGNPEEYYKRMVDEYPCHPLFLRKYGQALEAKGDFDGAEEFYFRATLANPSDGEALCQYAELVWQLRHDQDKALSYFERAAQASPHDSNVLAAYASFLWEIEDDSEEDEACRGQIEVLYWSFCSLIQDVTGNGVPDTAAAGSRSDDPEENYKMMIEEKPNNALLLRNYAQFLWRSKGDLQEAQEYYLQATLADPGDGEIMAQYATLVWELHHDSKRALSYFERAAQTNPEDTLLTGLNDLLTFGSIVFSYILAAYAHFLWEHDEEDEDSVTQAHGQAPLVQGVESVGNA